MEDAARILPLYVEAGFTTIEVPINCDNAEQLIQYIVSNCGDRLNVGAGSVIDVSDLDKALGAGACFIV
ncbi:2-dehydro-3-deoxyphosphogluconate aldolase, partial [Parapusillimonas sp. SGNA-6]|nr:2-dehydro-3-deoxyphosphogluconate aldolase [Parapusillimonas sp. SGNA-6]